MNVSVAVAVGVSVGVKVCVAVGVAVSVLVAVGVGVSVAVFVAVAVGVSVGVLVDVLVGVKVAVGVGLEAVQPVVDEAFAAPGVMQRSERSTLFRLVSDPSGKRDRPINAVILSSAATVPVPSVYGEPVSPS